MERWNEGTFKQLSSRSSGKLGNASFRTNICHLTPTHRVSQVSTHATSVFLFSLSILLSPSLRSAHSQTLLVLRRVSSSSCLFTGANTEAASTRMKLEAPTTAPRDDSSVLFVPTSMADEWIAFGYISRDYGLILGS